MGGRVTDPARSVRALFYSWSWVLRRVPIADSSLPGVRHLVHTRRVAEDNNGDRMSLWLQNVESERFLPFSVELELIFLQRLSLRRGRTSKLPGRFSQYRSHPLHPRHVDHPSEGQHNVCLGRSSQLTRFSTRMAKPASVLTRLKVHRPLPTLQLSPWLNPPKLVLSSKRLPFCFPKRLP